MTSIVDAIKAEVIADYLAGFPWGGRIPITLASWSELHDYCDANDYLPDVDVETANAVTSELARWIRSGGFVADATRAFYGIDA